MKPTDILSSEHRVIEQVLDCLENIIAEAMAKGRLDAASARDAISFFRTFADQCHHGKEETHLFPALEAKGFPAEGGPTGVMRREHETGRGCIRAMDGAVVAAAQGDREALQRFAQAGEGYIGLLRQHIEKEDHCLFSMANEALTDEDQAELLAKFEKVETGEMGHGTHEKFLALAGALAEKYGVQQKAAAHAGHGMTCCNH
jgi:hemerythrin-like domain-containing protein